MAVKNIKKTDPEKKYREVMGASTLNGDAVRNSAGEKLGSIEEIMLDVPNGRVAYAVLSFGGFLGMGDKLFAIPWSELTLDEDEKCFVLEADREKLERAPGFDKDNWPDMADPSWRDQIYDYYGAERYWDEDTTSDLRSTTRDRTLRGTGPGGGLLDR